MQIRSRALQTALSPAFSPRRAGEKAAELFAEFVLLTLAAQLTTIPIMAYQLQRISLVSFIANPFILPTQPAVMILGGLAVLLSHIWFPLGQLASWVAWPFVVYTIRAVELFDQVPHGTLLLGSLSIWFVILFYAVLYFETLKTYTKSHRLKREDGAVVPWIDENLNPLSGDWIARTRLKSWKDGTWDPGKGGVERGKDYNHSTYCDLIITGLVGLRPQAGDTVVVNPLLPEDTWDFFCLDGVPYHGRLLTILWDRTGERYQKGKGLRAFADGREIAASAILGRITGTLPEIPAERRSSRESGK